MNANVPLRLVGVEAKPENVGVRKISNVARDAVIVRSFAFSWVSINLFSFTPFVLPYNGIGKLDSHFSRKSGKMPN